MVPRQPNCGSSQENPSKNTFLGLHAKISHINIILFCLKIPLYWKRRKKMPRCKKCLPGMTQGICRHCWGNALRHSQTYVLKAFADLNRLMICCGTTCKRLCNLLPPACSTYRRQNHHFYSNGCVTIYFDYQYYLYFVLKT